MIAVDQSSCTCIQQVSLHRLSNLWIARIHFHNEVCVFYMSEVDQHVREPLLAKFQVQDWES